MKNFRFLRVKTFCLEIYYTLHLYHHYVCYTQMREKVHYILCGFCHFHIFLIRKVKFSHFSHFSNRKSVKLVISGPFLLEICQKFTLANISSFSFAQKYVKNLQFLPNQSFYLKICLKVTFSPS